MAKFKKLIPNPMIIQKVRKQQLKYIAILPSLITLLNAIAGFIAIGYTSRAVTMERAVVPRFGFSLFALAGYMIILAMIADMLDGRVARLSKSTSSFGGQLDSLSDAISFGVAPAFLMTKVVEGRLKLMFADFPGLPILMGRFVGLIAVLYVCCTIIRLARFNVENEEDESAHMSFSGLPSPAAAGTIVSLVIFQQDLLPKIANRSDQLFIILESFIFWTLPIVTLVAAVLMVTRIRYPHLVNQYFKGKKSFSNFMRIVLAVLLVIWNIQLAIVIGFCGFALWGLVRWGWLALVKRPKTAATEAPSEGPADHEAGRSEDGN